MSEVTWRSFLGDIFRLMDPGAKRAFAQQLGVTLASIYRWLRTEDVPKRAKLVELLTLLPGGQREQMLALMRADPNVMLQLSDEERKSEETSVETLDSFCLNLLRLQRDSPDRFWQLSGAILRKCLALLETHPQQVGIEIVVATCMPPRDGNVRSLRAIVGMGTPPWQSFLHEKDYFLGLNSLAGNVVVTRRGKEISDLAQSPAFAPAPFIEHERSAAAFPIMHTIEGSSPEMAVAGAIIASCTQPDYFSDASRMEILEVFADLIRLALHEYIFYRAFQIDLVALPLWEKQREILATFWEKFTVAKARAEGQHTYAEVEALVRKQLEGELLQVAYRTMAT